jgi:D-lactate dehydrogenase
MAVKSVAFFDAKPYDEMYFNAANEDYGFSFEYFETRLDRHTAKLSAGADAVCVFVNDTVDNETLDILDNQGVKLVALRCAGYNNVDIKAAYQRIHVARVPSYSPNAIAEHAVALLFALSRHIPQSYNRVREGNFLLNGLTGCNLCGKTAGIVGTGKIGKIVAAILSGVGMRIIAYDKFPNTAWAAEAGVEYCEFADLCAQSDVISLHSPLTEETYHLVNEDALALMKSGVILINTGRGGLLDTKALIHALKKRRIGGAGLDVYEEEEKYFYQDWSGSIINDDTLARLLTFPNVLITGHQAFLTDEALTAIARTTLENIRLFFAGEPIPNEICYQCSGLEQTPDCKRGKTGMCF